MKTLRDMIKGKPSNALFAMVKGLKHHSKRKTFKVDMMTFGGKEPPSDKAESKRICFGCAATCAVQELTKKNLRPSFTSHTISRVSERAKFFELNVVDLNSFELAIDNARTGDFHSLFYYCGIEEPFLSWSLSNDFLKSIERREFPTLNNSGWKVYIKIYEDFAKFLQERGY